MVELSSGVEEVLENPTSGEEISIIVTIEDGFREEAISAIESVGGVVEMDITDSHLAITIDQRTLSELCAIEKIESIEVEGQGRVLSTEDFQHPAG